MDLDFFSPLLVQYESSNGFHMFLLPLLKKSSTCFWSMIHFFTRRIFLQTYSFSLECIQILVSLSCPFLGRIFPMWFFLFPQFIWINNVKGDHKPLLLEPLIITHKNFVLRGGVGTYFPSRPWLIIFAKGSKCLA